VVAGYEKFNQQHLTQAFTSLSACVTSFFVF